MVFSSKQLEEIENMHDSTGSFEDSEGSESSGDTESGEAAMEWRRGLLEEAAENVKRARTRPVDPEITYEVGSLLFDRDSRRFARVRSSVPGFLRIVYLTGGDREYGLLDVDKYLKDFGEQKKLGELSIQLGIDLSTVDEALDRLGLTPLPDDEEDKKKGKEGEAAAVEVAAPTPAEAKSAGKKTKNTKKATKSEAKLAATTTKAAKSTTKKSASKAAATTTKKAKGAKADPIADPNEFIKEHFGAMSNRELARETGLSEHTIRRKLGEWGLKRKK